MKCCHGQFTSIPNAGGNVHLEGGFWDMLIVEFDRDQVFAGLSYNIFNTTRSVLTIIKVQLGLRGTLHSNRQTPGSSLPGVDVELTYKCKGLFSVQSKPKQYKTGE